MLRLLAIIVLGLIQGAVLAACSNPPPPTPVAGARPLQAVPIDGTYGGVMQLTRGDAMNCGDENPITLQVRDNAFTYRLSQPQADWKPVIVFAATIGPDGSFNARSGSSSMSGRVVNGSMQGLIIGDVCGFSFNAGRGGTW